jgi:NADPH:quinone reductase-like Zn-dependent oxidoreductase
MKAIELKDFGGPEQLTEVEIPKPIAKTGQVVVRVHATSFNPVDVKRASGKIRDAFPVTFPFIPGGDLSGTIDSLGDNITGYAVGNEVYGDTETAGAYAEFIAINVDRIARKPRNLTHVEAASLSLVAQTALQALDHAHLEAGQTILIHGAAGAVGSAAIQLAHLRGAHVIATAAQVSFDRLRSYGADQLIDYKTTAFESAIEHPVDAVLDTIGGEVQQRSYTVLKPGGTLVAIAQPPSQVEAAKHHVRALFFSTVSSPETLHEVTQAIESGHLTPFVARTYPLSQAAQAWRDIANDHPEGKVVFTVLPE